MERYIFTNKINLGILKIDAKKGTVLDFDPENRVIKIDGKTYNDCRDFEILLNMSKRTPSNPILVPFSVEVYEKIRREIEAAIPNRTVKPVAPKMKIEGSDEDGHQEIDIRHTQVGKNNAERIAAERNRTRTAPLEVVNGEEGLEDRIERLRGAKKQDLSALAERVSLMKERAADMPIVRDDSLGVATSKYDVPLNAGSKIGGKREMDEADRARAEAYKADVLAAKKAQRAKALADAGLPDTADYEVATVPMETPASTTPIEDTEDFQLEESPVKLDTKPANSPSPVSAEMSELKSQFAALQAQQAEMMKIMMAAIVPPKAEEKKGPGRPKKVSK